MTDDTTPDAPAADEPKPVAPDAHRTDATPEPTLEGEQLQDKIAELSNVVTTDPEPVAAPEPEAPAEPDAPAEAEAAPGGTAEAPTGYENIADPFAADAPSVDPLELPEPPVEDEAPKPAKKPRAPKAPKVAVEVADETDEEPAAPAEEPAPPAEPPPENKKKWYAIKVQSGREDTIKAAILRKVAIEGHEDSFGQIMIPYEEVIEKKSVRVKDKKTGEYTTQEKKVARKKKKFQGYLFAELEFNDRILYLFRETSGVGDFLNLRGTPPVPEPMSDTEVQQMLTGEKKSGPGDKGKKVKLEFEKGDRVRIREGSFKDSEGEVTAISEPKDPTDAPKITVVVTFWGRPLPVELEYWQVAKA